MPGRHRLPVPPRVLPKRLVAAGASGVVTVLALAPLANAETPADDVTTSAAPTSETPTSEAPSSAAPSSEAPSSEAPSSEAPSSAAPSSEDPSSAAPSSEAPSSGAPSATVPASSAPTTSAPAAKKRAVLAAPIYGNRKISVTAELDESDYYPADTTTAGSTFRIVETGSSPRSTTCTTEPDFRDQGASVCFFGEEIPGFPSGYELAAPDNTVTITQLTASAGTVVDPTVFRSVPCVTIADPGNPTVPLCQSQDQSATFADGGLPPVVSDASQTLTSRNGAAVTIGPDSQINRQGAPATSVDVDEPAHGTVTVNQAAAPLAITNTPVTRPFTLTYTPTAGYVGPDSFRYRVTTANGTSAYVTVLLRVVGAAPTASDDKDTTTEGDAVRIAVLGNDKTNGGGAITITDVADPKHGTARVSGRSVVYTPADGFSGTETFSYAISSYSGTDTATITVRVKADANDNDNDTGGDTDGAGTNGNEVSTADTGVPTEALLEIGGVLLLAGAGATVVGRRRRHA